MSDRISADAKAILAYDTAKKSTGVAYVIWLFFGILGAHRFYAGRKTSGSIMLALFIVAAFPVVVIGPLVLLLLAPNAIWALIDFFLVPGMVRSANQKILAGIMA